MRARQVAADIISPVYFQIRAAVDEGVGEGDGRVLAGGGRQLREGLVGVGCCAALDGGRVGGDDD